MDLTFNKEGENFVAEFEATADFNLHIERNKGGNILLYVRTQGGGYDIVDDFGVQKHQGVIDYDCTALVYPKWIKIVSEVEPTYAAVVSDGEVTEIKAQSKEVEVTSNGTTVVEPDAGFAYLNKVSVKTNVPQSGEGGGSSSKVRYFNVKPLIDIDLNQATGLLKMSPGLLAIKAEGNFSSIVPMAAISSEYYNEITSAAILDNFRGFIDGANDLNSSDLILQMLQFGCNEITEEEFYTLETA